MDLLAHHPIKLVTNREPATASSKTLWRADVAYGTPAAAAAWGSISLRAEAASSRTELLSSFLRASRSEATASSWGVLTLPSARAASLRIHHSGAFWSAEMSVGTAASACGPIRRNAATVVPHTSRS